jgi:hypothetical protein
MNRMQRLVLYDAWLDCRFVYVVDVHLPSSKSGDYKCMGKW